ncbi:MAG: GNAT family N-acetyltransferase [Variibacter sp.]|nr:GNAT family N-acetyltransferase [Variibacter sp.]
MHEFLPDGGTIRKLWFGESELYRDHLLRLDPESRRARFGGAVSDAFIRDYVARPFGAERIVHGFFVAGTMRGAAELRPVRALAGVAEVALSIEQPWQGGGVGSALFSHTLLAARNRGIRKLRMMCLAENRRMRMLARKFDAELSFEDDSVIGELETPFPTPLSVMQEMMTDGAALAAAVLDAQRRLLRPA